MMKYFLVSSLILILTGCSTVSEVNNKECIPVQTQLWTNDLRSAETLNKYQVAIEVNGNRISGICMLKKTDEGWKGTLINEFGAKAFDFTVTAKKCELLNTISLMDKWYIRKTIASDLYYLFGVDDPQTSFYKKVYRCQEGDILKASLSRKKIVSLYPDDKIILKNLKYNIVYTLDKLHE